jgi:transcriptional regulator with XRE-family HTH domain
VIVEQPPTAEQVIGDRLRDWRKAYGVSREAIARSARSNGLRWTGATVVEIEEGRKRFTIAQLALLPDIIEGAGNDDTRHVDFTYLLPDEQSISLGEQLQTTGIDLRRQLVGGPELLPLGSSNEGSDAFLWRFAGQSPAVQRARTAQDRQYDRLTERLGAATDPFARHAWERGLIDDATKRVAKKMRRKVEDVAYVAALLYGRAISDESERRVRESGREFGDKFERRTVLGRVTRDLREEITAELSKPRKSTEKGARR